MPPAAAAPSAELVKQAAALLKGAKNPLMLVGRVSRSLERWNERVALAEALNCKVMSDLKIGSRLPDRSSAACRPPQHHRARPEGDRGRARMPT